VVPAEYYTTILRLGLEKNAVIKILGKNTQFSENFRFSDFYFLSETPNF
jgi:hypothetical protein